jgi:hypothetical protein
MKANAVVMLILANLPLMPALAADWSKLYSNQHPNLNQRLCRPTRASSTVTVPSCAGAPPQLFFFRREADAIPCYDQLMDAYAYRQLTFNPPWKKCKSVTINYRAQEESMGSSDILGCICNETDPVFPVEQAAAPAPAPAVAPAPAPAAPVTPPPPSLPTPLPSISPECDAVAVARQPLACNRVKGKENTRDTNEAIPLIPNQSVWYHKRYCSEEIRKKGWKKGGLFDSQGNLLPGCIFQY